MSRAIQHRTFGGLEVLEMAQVADASPGPGEVRLAVHTVGLNPVEAKSVAGAPPLRAAEYVNMLRRPSRWFGRGPARFPRTVGRDFAGVIDAVGAGVTGLSVGDAVLGTLRSAPGQGSTRGSLIEELVAVAEDVVRKPEALSFEVAGSLGVSAQTASGALRALGVTAGDVLVISAAAGGVGSLAAQLAVHRGATVVGIASQANSDYLRSLGVIPVPYGAGLAARLKESAPGPVTTFLDCYGGDYVKMALAMGVPARRVGTLIPAPAAMLKGVQFTGSRHAQAGDLQEVVDLVAAGTVSVLIDKVYPFDVDSVRAAYQQLLGGHARGKVVIAVR